MAFLGVLWESSVTPTLPPHVARVKGGASLFGLSSLLTLMALMSADPLLLLLAFRPGDKILYWSIF